MTVLLNWLRTRLGDKVLGVSLIVLFGMGLAVTGYVFFLAFTYPEVVVEYGTWGDFIGGTLNPILTFFAFTGVLLSIFLQRLELSMSRAELQRSANALEQQISSIEKQNFEAAFFQMLNTFNSIVASIDLHNKNSGQETSGRDCFRVFYTRLNKIFRENQKKGAGKYQPEEVFRLSYHNFWQEHQLELGHYFRFLYNVFRFLDESEAAEAYHAKLLRAQLSDQELLLLFYNCLTKQGENFRAYASKFEVFDNLPTVRLLEDDHVEWIEPEALGKNPIYTSKTIRSTF